MDLFHECLSGIGVEMIVGFARISIVVHIASQGLVDEPGIGQRRQVCCIGKGLQKSQAFLDCVTMTESHWFG